MADTQLSDESVPILVHELGDELRQLVADEVAVAKAELKVSLNRTIKVVAGTAVVVLGATLLLIFGLVTLVEWRPNHTLVAGIIAAVGILLMLVGAVVIWANRRLLPFGRISASLKEDLEWAKRQTKRVRP